MSDVEALSDSDVCERLLPVGPDHNSRNESEQQDGITHQKLMHSIGSFSAVVWPVAVTMLFARCVSIPWEGHMFRIVLRWTLVCFCSFVSLQVADPALAQALAKYVATVNNAKRMQKIYVFYVPNS